MDTRVEKIATSFLENGRKLVGSVDVSSNWWFDDIILWNQYGIL